MKPFSALLLVFSLLLVANNLGYARKDQGEYWKNIMNGEAMPEAIKELLVQDPQLSSYSNKYKDNFIRDFDVKPNVILYHTHVVSKNQKQNHNHNERAFVKKLKPEFQVTGIHD